MVIHALRRDSQKKRAVGYARVSTADEHQDSSYRLQIQELETSIRLNPRYEFIGIFKDRKSGSNTKGRQEFTAMIDLAMMGEIDVIITKSITRFARNIIDTISIVRELKNKNVEVFFQKEGISTLDPSLEMILTVLAMHAEEELKNISANTIWSKKRKIARGGSLTTVLYGYKIKNDIWTIVPKEARVVRMVFDMYINKKSYREMTNELLASGIKSPSGKEKWSIGAFESILQNEKYAGHLSHYKTYIYNDTRVRSSRLSREENMILNHHKPIVEPEVYEAAMNLRKSRTKNNREAYVPFSDSVTPYYQFVYSHTNEKYLKFVVEKPKGKYEIPTLFCYNKERLNRVMITVKNLFALLNDALASLSVMVNNGFGFSDILSSALSLIESELETAVDNKNQLLTQKVLLIEGQRRIGAFIRIIKNFKTMDNVEDFKTLVKNVEILKNGKIKINLSLIEGTMINETILDSSISLRVGNTTKKLLFFVSV